MGSACCCLRDEFDDFANNRSTSCICLHYFIRNFVHMYTSLFHGGEEASTLPSSSQGTQSLTSMPSDGSFADTYRSPPRPLPYAVDTRYSCMANEGPASRREKGSSHSNEETEPLRPNELEGESMSMSATRKLDDFSCQEASKECCDSQSPLKLSTVEPATVFAHIYATSEDEDVCPTCLEEYTTENPKMITKCCHHYHLGCIYEWMERSDNCPVCGKVMAFDEKA